MEKKIQKRFVYDGFGFPVVLKNVPMIKARGGWTPDINYNELMVAVLRALAIHESQLTGSEVKFIRQYFEMTLQQFADRFDVSHPAVLKWEKTGAGPANMRWTTEKDLRLFILDKLGETPKDLVATYRRLVRPARPTPRPVAMDLSAA